MPTVEEPIVRSQRPVPISMVLLIAFAIHAPLLLMELPLRSYDTNFHIFFASHYVRHWFDPWNPKWYAGFSQTTYPPLPQQWVALISHVTGLDLAYMVVQLIAILLLAVGAYRFSRLWVDPRAASLAALASVLLGSESFLVYNAGQLSTTVAAPLYLNALPYLYEWVRHGRWRGFFKGSVLCVAAAAAHHATLLFGSFLFCAPVLVLALIDRQEGERVSTGAFSMRTIAVAIFIGIAIAIVLLPFWIALIHYPVTQTPIPHPSRANYILSPAWGLNYFIVPYGALLLAVPFVIIRGSSDPRLRPLMFGFWVAFLLGLGGTTPVGHWLLGRAFEVITMERFSYWANLLALPFVGLLAEELIDRFRLKAVVGLAIAAGMTCAWAVAWDAYHPTDAANFSVDSIATWLNRDGHDRYRYVTLGFGNKISRLAILTDASSVDGEWNSGRMLPELTAHGGAALTSSKYFGQSGLDALTAILHHADRYGLKWVIMRDPYYEPLLVFAGWRKVDSVEDGTISIWGKEDVPPATPVNAPQIPPAWQGLLWGTLPIGSSFLAILLAFIPDRKRAEHLVMQPEARDRNLALGRMIS
ncbi:MAG TPA: 6-pyruvoyl-tetrahydropterin synthase-related protein [Terriglobales bacterium]|nr:6-pyruvoyl-tetrahydropterin synthase-related protein [Terriglobales bacterium]